MRIENYVFPESSFLSLEKDAALIINKMLKNKRLQKLLYYADRHCLELPDLTQEQAFGLINKQIRLTPQLIIDPEILSYVVISFDQFLPNSNPQFRDNLIVFNIICHYDQWNLGDFKLRPFVIAGEIDAMLNNKHLTGIGTLEFVRAYKTSVNDELAGFSLAYKVIHGREDKV